MPAPIPARRASPAPSSDRRPAWLAASRPSSTLARYVARAPQAHRSVAYPALAGSAVGRVAGTTYVDLADALIRLDRAAELVEFNASPTTEPLYTVSPFDHTDRVARMFVTHPPLADRVARLRV